MNRHLHHALANAVFPKYNLRLDQLNRNALLRAWLSQHEIPVFADRQALHVFVERMGHGEAVDYLEFGVFEGESIRMWTALNRRPESRFFGFDSFEGLPTDWGYTMKKGDFSLGGRVPELTDPRVTFQKGWFNDTLPRFLEVFSPRSRIVVHNDSDLYSSSLFLLCQLDRIMIPGSVIIFDEFFSALHEFRAFCDYTDSYRRSLRPVGRTADGAGRVAFVFE